MPSTPPASPPRGVRFEHFPVRRAIQWALGIGLIVFVVVGTVRTLSLSRAQGGLTLAGWRDLIVFGIANGSVIALIALGYSLVYGILFMINFAHGEVFMSGAFASYFVAVAMNQHGFLNEHPAIAIPVLLVVGMLVSTFVAVVVERIAYRPLRNAPRLVPLITAIGASLFLQNTFKEMFGAQTRGYPVLNVLSGYWHVLGIPVLRAEAIVILTAVGALIFLTLFVSRTKTGKAMRAVAHDKEIAALMG
ncbi:MAG TPA: branched-chain amino acid ABC transporter permease, partial [Actinomycetota bacterium]|nr:branched-chain amino acid ABC transporter permease [Actinomycetota bacterium]